jgi:hypothetical protein
MRCRRPSVPRGTTAGVERSSDGVLVQTLLDRGAEGDVVEAEAAIERLAAARADEGLVMRDIWLQRLPKPVSVKMLYAAGLSW